MGKKNEGYLVVPTHGETSVYYREVKAPCVFLHVVSYTVAVALASEYISTKGTRSMHYTVKELDNLTYALADRKDTYHVIPSQREIDIAMEYPLASWSEQTRRVKNTRRIVTL